MRIPNGGFVLSLLLTSALSILMGPSMPARTPDLTEPRLLRMPTIHGDTIVFTYAGDLWESKIAPGSPAKRLTSFPDIEARAKISPDGTMIAFTASYDGNPDVYVMPIEGGEPKRLTFEPQSDLVVNWTPDNKIAYVSNFGSNAQRALRLWIVDPKGGLPKPTPIRDIYEGSFSADGNTLAYSRSPSYRFNWRHYRGGTQGRVSLYNFATNTYSELPAGRDQNHFPMYVGKSIYFISDRKYGVLNLFKHDGATGKDEQLTDFKDADIRYPSTDGKSIVYERDGFLYRFDVATKKIEKLSPKIVGENLAARPRLRSLANQITGLTLSPSGTRMAVEARGEIFSVPAKQGDTRNITQTPGVREQAPSWSPDGKSIAYVSDVNGDPQLYVQPQQGGKAEQLTTTAIPDVTMVLWAPDSKKILLVNRVGKAQLVDVAAKTAKLINDSTVTGSANGIDWSPDSKWISMILPGKNQLGALHLYEVSTGKLTKVTEGYYNDVDATFDLNGKFLYLLSERTFEQVPASDGGFVMSVQDAQRVYVIPLSKDTPNPFVKDSDEEALGAPDKPKDAKKDSTAGKIDFEGFAERAMPLPWPASTYRGVLGTNNGVLLMGPTGVQKFDLDSKQSEQIFSGPVGGLVFNANRTKMAFLVGSQLHVSDVRPGVTPGPGRVDTSGVEAVIDPRAEWKQIFWDVWRYERDNFYDPGMVGLNWYAIGKQYEAYLPFVNHRADLNEILGLMIGELGTGHAYIMAPGDYGMSGTPIPTGLLGADYEADEKGVKFKKIYRGQNFDESRRSPLGEPGINVKEGDYLVAIDGKRLDANTNPSSLLVNRAGKTVTITVNSRNDMVDARTYRVKTVGDETAMRYAEWVEHNRALVEKLSGGKIGYVHVPNTGQEGANEFARGFRAMVGKDALIVDERDNGGGNLPTYFIERLLRKNLTYVQPRGGVDSSDSEAVPGPKVMLINQNAGSGGDMFPYLFRQAGVGMLIGKRTWGGLVGIAGAHPLIDGGGVTAPEFSIYDPATNEIVAENQGVDPDIDIDNRPDQVIKGQDAQLEKAIEVLLEQIKKLPAKPVRKTIPKVGEKARIKP